eukprot:TRINITY_DN20176_c0_g1_i1.p1 TRINITY_DN20176_c0_g1~~TRINITY_DN20176_c0_g1_i1.p1  ORF type:complete len:203 (+),score=28.41 TRINITY_DN20176_c0_g1_i1:142-750(+)
MGFWDVWYSTTNKLKINGPDLRTPVTNVCRRSYDLTWAAVSKVDDVVRINGAQKLKEHLPDSEGQEKIGRILKKIGKYAADAAVNESLKGVTGGVQIYKIVRDGLKDQPGSHTVHDSKKELKEMQQKIEKMQEELNNISSHNKILLERVKGLEPPTTNSFHMDSRVVQKPEEVISLFMMKGFKGGNILDALIVPKIGYLKKP